MFWSLFIIVSCIKTLYIPSYRSTDFEVHRNWLAITSSLPHQKWYQENTSEWTLDYPPYFAWFEFGLAQVAKHFDPEMLKIENLNYASEATILFQRLSVIATDFVFALGVKHCAESLGKRHSHQNSMTLLLLGNAGLFMVDHIHFQYNGFLSGVLLLSISAIASHNTLLAALLFSALLMFKHIYLYIAPAFIVFMFRSYCFKTNSNGNISWSSFSLVKLIMLAVVVLFNVGLAMGPFVISDNLSHIISRLFPFKRGLCHAYWAPNFWAVYNTADKVLAVAARHAGLDTGSVAGSMTGGLVQDIHHSVLPDISPLTTALLTLVAMVPALAKLWTCPSNTNQFIRCLALCAWTSFLLGWHVHEKAILLVILPMTLLGCTNKQDARWFSLIAAVGHLSLFPLFFTSPELPSKLLLHLSFLLLMFETVTTSLCAWEKLYLTLSIPLVVFCELITVPSLPFLPLLVYSLYCAAGVIYTYVRVYINFLCY